MLGSVVLCPVLRLPTPIRNREFFPMAPDSVERGRNAVMKNGNEKCHGGILQFIFTKSNHSLVQVNTSQQKNTSPRLVCIVTSFFDDGNEW